MKKYQEKISTLLSCDPASARLVEAYMRLEHSTLDGLSAAAFAREARIGLECVLADRPEAELLAKSFGL